MDYTVTHVTRFQYQSPVHESVTEVRLAPRHDARQEVQWFELTTQPATTIFRYVDALGNDVHHFDIIAPHQELLVQTRMRVRTLPARTLPEHLEPSAWDTLERMRVDGQLWDFWEPSPAVPLSPAVGAFGTACGLARAADPLTCVRRIISGVYSALLYTPDSTTVDTPLATVLETRRGVCQDFAHVALAIARGHGIPCRYVSGYFAPASDESGAQTLASHAWVEAWLPGLEWTAFDPTHDVVAGERHISVAVGRDYGDAAPTRGVFRGGSAGTLSVSVRIEQGSGTASTSKILIPRQVATQSEPSVAQRQQQ